MKHLSQLPHRFHHHRNHQSLLLYLHYLHLHQHNILMHLKSNKTYQLLRYHQRCRNRQKNLLRWSFNHAL